MSAYRETVTAFRRELLTTTLQAHGGNRTHAAAALGIERAYLQRLIRALRVTVPAPGRWRKICGEVGQTKGRHEQAESAVALSARR